MKIIKTAIILGLATFASLAAAGEIKPYTQAQFDSLTGQGKPVLVVVKADWCTTCQAQKPIIGELMGQSAYKDVTALEVDFDNDKPALKKYKVAMQSTLIAFKGKKEVGRSAGDSTKPGIEGLVEKTIN